MRHRKDDPQSMGRRKKLGVVGVSLSLAGLACAESTAAQASASIPAPTVRTLDLREVEMLDVTLGSFRLFDREDAQDVKGYPVTWWNCRCRGCGRRGCCRGCRGCAG
jgi:hypothetical protein